MPLDEAPFSLFGLLITCKLTWGVHRYSRAQICYVYLFDVTASDVGNLCDIGGYMDGYERTNAFGTSEWWSRGWTLQELIAPDNVVFFDKDWVRLGTKSSLRSVSMKSFFPLYDIYACFPGFYLVSKDLH